MSIGIITAIYGNYDLLRPLPPDHGFDQAVCVTDNRSMAADGWNIVYEPSPLHSRMAAKKAKMMPWLYLDTSSGVWLDGSRSVKSSSFVDFAKDHLYHNDIVVWNHPDGGRDCYEQEAVYCQGWAKYRNYNMDDQVSAYKMEGMPSHYGLWACSVIGWSFTNEAIDFGRAWYGENEKWSIQDQVSFPYVAWKLNKRFGVWKAHELHNDYIDFHAHIGLD